MVKAMEMMDVIKKRMSIRSYKDQPLSEETIKNIMEAAKYAPSARNLMQLEYRVITNQNLIKKISDRIGAALTKEMAANPPRPGSPPRPPMPDRPHFFYQAPLLVLVTGPKDNPWSESDAALAVENIMIYATSQGLGTCFIGMAKLVEKDPELLQELHIDKNRKIAAAVICGYPNEKPEPKEKQLNAEYFK